MGNRFKIWYQLQSLPLRRVWYFVVSQLFPWPSFVLIYNYKKKNSENNENRHISVGLQWFASIWWMSRSKTQREEWCDNRISQWHQGNICLILWIADGRRLHNSTKGRKSSQCFGLYIHTYIQCYIYEIVNEQVSPCSIKQPWYHYLSPRI